MGKGQGSIDFLDKPATDVQGHDFVHVHSGEAAMQSEAAVSSSAQQDASKVFGTAGIRRSFLSEAWAITALFILSFIFCILSPVLAMGWVFLPFTHGIWHFTVFVLLYTITQNLPPFYSRKFKDGPFHAPIIRELVNYAAECKIIKECELDPKHNYVFAWHPHGRMFYGFGMLVGLFSSWFPEITNSGHDIFGGINDMMFRIPFVGNWLYLIGLIGCHKKSVTRKLKQGDSVGLIVGGIEEVLEGTFDDKDVLYLKNRKGFIKIAMDHGSGVVPCFCFGENSLFMHESEQTLNFWRWVNKFVKLGAPFPIKGWMGTPFPMRIPMLIAIGKPMFALEGESVNDFHARYMDELQKLYAKYVGMTSDPKRKLVIV